MSTPPHAVCKYNKSFFRIQPFPRFVNDLTEFYVYLRIFRFILELKKRSKPLGLLPLR